MPCMDLSIECKDNRHTECEGWYYDASMRAYPNPVIELACRCDCHPS